MGVLENLEAFKRGLTSTPESSSLPTISTGSVLDNLRSFKERSPEFTVGPVVPAPTSFRNILDLINTPQQLIYGGVEGLLTGRPVIESALQGARTDISASRLLETMGMGEGGSVDLPVLGKVTGRGALGLGLDIFTDPLIFAGKASRAMGLGDRFVNQAAKVVPSQLGGDLFIGELSKGLRGYGERVKGLKAVRKAEQEKTRLSRGHRALGRAEEMKRSQQIAEVAKKHNLTKEQVEERIRRLVELDPKITKVGVREKNLISRAEKLLATDGELSPLQIKDLNRLIKGAKELKPRDIRYLGKVEGKYGKVAYEGRYSREVEEYIQKQSYIKKMREKGKGRLISRELKATDRGIKKLESALKKSLSPTEIARGMVDDISKTEYLLPAAKIKLQKQIARKIGASKKNPDVNFRTHATEIYSASRAQLLEGLRDDIKDIVTIADDLVVKNQQLRLDQIVDGVASPTLSDAGVLGLGYFHHMLTPEAKKILIEADPALRRFGLEFNPRHSFQIERKLKGNIDDLQKQWEAGEITNGVKQAGRLFIDDPAMVMMTREAASINARANARLYTGVADELGKNPRVTENVEHWRRLVIQESSDKRLLPLQERLGDKVFAPEVADHLDQLYHVTMNPDNPNSLDTFLNFYDAIQNNWKVTTLFAFPAYHARNVVGNVWNNFLAGIKNPRYFEEARRFQRAVPDTKETFNFGGRTYTHSEMSEQLQNWGISDQFKAFLALGDEALIKENKLLLEKVPGIGQVLGLGKKVGGFIEDNARIGHFFAKLDKGLKVSDAAMSVKKYLFNYNDLTKFEQSVLRRVAPFYAWTRFNIPLQIRGIVERPEMYAALGDITEAVERGTPKPRDEDKLVAEWMKENSAVRVRENESGNPEYFLMGGWIPAADINRVFAPIGEMLSMLGPLKVTAEMYFNKDAFLGRDIENFPGEKEKFLGLTLSKRKMIQPLKQIRILTEIDRILAATQETGVFGDTKITGRKGEDLGVAIIRTISGAKLYPLDERRRRFELRRRRQQLVRDQRYDRLRKRGVNQEVLDRLIENPELLD